MSRANNTSRKAFSRVRFRVGKDRPCRPALWLIFGAPTWPRVLGIIRATLNLECDARRTIQLESTMETYAFRLLPGQDLKAELDAFAERESLEAACVLACVGSLTRAVLRFANQSSAETLEGHFEIISLTGVLSRHGSHIHIGISDGQGRTYGAHLMDGSLIYTTAEIVIGALPGVSFRRTHCNASGYLELDVQPMP